MLIVGAKGFAKEVLEILYQLDDIDNLVFYDDVNKNVTKKLYNKYSILTTINEAENYLKTVDNRFTIGIGNPILRKKLSDKFITLSGQLTSTISKHAKIGQHGVCISKGANILDQAIISNDVSIGLCAMVYYNAIVTHDVQVGNFVEISPAATLLGRCSVGDFSQIGSHATILPDVVVGSNVIVAAGAVVTKNVPDNCMVAGVPAVLKKELEPLSFLNE